MNEGKQNDMNRSMRRTKGILKEKFIWLIEVKGYSNVTVKDIVELADFNRSTFYFYFKDKEDLLYEIVKEKMQELEDCFRLQKKKNGLAKTRHGEHSMVDVFKHIYKNKKFYNLLNKPNNIPRFQTSFFEEFRVIIEKDILDFSDVNQNIDVNQYSIFVIYGVFGIILEWIRSDYAKSVEELNDNLLDILIKSFNSSKT